jgi:large subunit ribosomal protein L23
MAIFGKKEDTAKTAAPATDAKPTDAAGVKKAKATAPAAKPAQKPAAKPAKSEKKSKKPAVDAGKNLTKAPGRILLAPRITEKAAYMTLVRGHVFEVAADATKRDVVAAIKALYNVTPVKVNIVRKQPRTYIARTRNRRGTKSGMKKAYVFLKEGDKIEIV